MDVEAAVPSHTHVPVSRRAVLDDPVHSLDAHLLDSFTAGFGIDVGVICASSDCAFL
jgi:hypothetical protein